MSSLSQFAIEFPGDAGNGQQPFYTFQQMSSNNENQRYHRIIGTNAEQRAKEIFENNPGRVQICGVVIDQEDNRSTGSGSSRIEGIAVYPNGTIVEGIFCGGEHNICDEVLNAHVTTMEDTVYSGAIRKGEFEGPGTFISGTLSYHGQFSRGFPEGTGECTKGAVRPMMQSDDDTDVHAVTYNGMWRSGLPHGQGTLSACGNEQHYTGEWIAGKPHGSGVIRKSVSKLADFSVHHDHGIQTGCIPKEDPELERMRQLVEEAPSVCKICFASTSTIVTKPCRHMCMCEQCYQNMVNANRSTVSQSKCPICRTEIVDILHAILG